MYTLNSKTNRSSLARLLSNLERAVGQPIEKWIFQTMTL